MATISLCMIVRNEEDVLARCLDSVKDLVDEIIIVDTGSQDKTKEIAAGYTDLVYDFIWTDDFAAARNFSFSKATMDYQMWLDADDVIEEEDREKFLHLKAELTAGMDGKKNENNEYTKYMKGERQGEADIVMLPYHVAFDAQGRPSMTYYRERLLLRKNHFIWDGPVHEAITPAGKIIYGETAVCHRKLHPSDPDRNLKIYEKMMDNGGIHEPRHQFYYGRELYYHERYGDAVVVLEKFLREGKGWIENNVSACLNLADCLMKLGRKEESLIALFRSFRYDVPRPEACCAIGNWLLEKGNRDRQYLKQAIYWYLQAKEQVTDEKSGAFVNRDCHDFIPDIQLCICYDRLGEITKAIEHHEKAKERKPDNPSVIYNEEYFTKKTGRNV